MLGEAVHGVRAAERNNKMHISKETVIIETYPPLSGHIVHDDIYPSHFLIIEPIHRTSKDRQKVFEITLIASSDGSLVGAPF